MGYGEWLHGEAVSAGMMMAAELSRVLGWIDAGDVNRIEAVLKRAGLPVFGPPMSPARYLKLMQHDKKVLDGKLRLVLLSRVGKAVVSDVATASEIAQAIAARSSNA
jgi:3-dehydroquinate synthase